MALKKKTSAVQKIVKKKVDAPVAPTKGKSSASFTHSVGRRKTAVARIRLFIGSGDNLINEKSVASYLPQEAHQAKIFAPFTVTDTREKFRFTVKVVGGGIHSQADAIAHGLARALVKVDETYKKALRDGGLLTRDPRMRETRKMGTGGKARRAKQSPKR